MKLKLRKYNCWELWLDSVECRIEQHDETFFSYVKGKWTESKDSTLEEAIETILMFIGIAKKEREKIKIELI